MQPSCVAPGPTCRTCGFSVVRSWLRNLYESLSNRIRSSQKHWPCPTREWPRKRSWPMQGPSIRFHLAVRALTQLARVGSCSVLYVHILQLPDAQLERRFGALRKGVPRHAPRRSYLGAHGEDRAAIRRGSRSRPKAQETRSAMQHTRAGSRYELICYVRPAVAWGGDSLMLFGRQRTGASRDDVVLAACSF